MNTHELAANLRRHARKIPSPAGDTPSVMVMAPDRLESTTCELAAMKAPPAPGDVRAALAGYAEWTGNPPVLTDAVELIDQQAQLIADLEAERDKLHARLTGIEVLEPVAWQCRFTNSIGWDRCTQEHYAHVRKNQAAWPDYEVRALIPTEPEAAR